MAAAVQQPMSANPQSFHHYATYSATGPVMSNSYSSSSPSTTSAPPPHPAPPPLVPSHDFAEQSQAPAHLAFASSYHPAPSPALAKRRSSKGKLPLDLIKRSSSTPQMRNLAAVEGDSMSPTTDKKRNKLGYHRTSVACGHCRRRKIRCLPAPDDPQGRCSNCIRLKKECNFYPVDQEAQHQPGKPGMAGSKPSLASNPSSPRTIATSSHESMEDFGAKYHNLSSGTPNARFVLSSDHEGSTTSSSGTGAMYQPPSALSSQHINPYPESVDESWNSGYYTPPVGRDGRFDSQTPAYWQPHEQEPSGPYDHDAKAAVGYSQPRLGSVSGISYTSGSESQGWTVPTRSMSYGNLEESSHQFSHQPSPQQRQNPHATRGVANPVAYSHPHALGSNTAAVAPASMSGSATLAAPGVVGGHGGVPSYGYPQAWNPMYTQAAAGSDPSMQGPAFAQHYYAEPANYQQSKGQQQQQQQQPPSQQQQQSQSQQQQQYAEGAYYHPPPEHMMR